MPVIGSRLCAVLLLVAATGWAQTAPDAGSDASPPMPVAQEVTFPAGDLVLHGRLFVPDGAGPFPAILWNHGSEKAPGPYLPGLARPFVAAGYVFFAPFRRGQGTSPGPYINDQVQAAPPAQRAQLALQLLQDQLTDQLGGLAYLQSQPNVITSQIAVMGGSYGGIQTLLGAEANPGYTAAVDCSGAAESWRGSPPLQARLEQAVANITIPVFLLQAQNDFDLSPTQVLGPLLQQVNPHVKTQIYPPYGSGAVGQEGHNMCFQGADVWSDDAISFIAASQAH
jgi:carboxymethylenebutenolidase